MDAIEKKLLEEVADLHGIPEGAYNIGADGKLAGRLPHASPASEIVAMIRSRLPAEAGK